MTVVLALMGRFWPYAAMVALALMAWHFDARAVANADTVRAQAAQFKQAQADATAIAQAALAHQNAVYAAKAKDADNAYQSQLADAQSAAQRYINSHRVGSVSDAASTVFMRVQSASAQGGSGATTASPQGISARSGNGPGTSPELVAVTANDIDVCTVNTKRLQVVRDWALTLNAAN